MVERGFLMVNLWLDCGDFVVNGWSYFGVEKYATDSGFIFWESHFGNRFLTGPSVPGRVTDVAPKDAIEATPA